MLQYLAHAVHKYVLESGYIWVADHLDCSTHRKGNEAGNGTLGNVSHSQLALPMRGTHSVTIYRLKPVHGLVFVSHKRK